jgi:hypothetical protein
MAGPAAGPFIGYGIDLQDCSTSGGSYVTVGPLVDLDGPDIKLGFTDVSYAQMAAAWKLKIAKLIDGGQVKFTLIWRETLYAHILGLLRTPYFFTIVMPDTGGTAGTKITFAGFYASLPIKAHLEDMIVSDVDIEVSGIISITAAT